MLMPLRCSIFGPVRSSKTKQLECGEPLHEMSLVAQVANGAYPSPKTGFPEITRACACVGMRDMWGDTLNTIQLRKLGTIKVLPMTFGYRIGVFILTPKAFSRDSVAV